MRDDNQGAKRDIQLELKALRLNGMAAAWAELTAQGGNSTLDSSRWLIEHLLQAEDVDRVMRSIAHQMKAARFPMHRDMAGFDLEASQVDKALIQKLADLSFTEDAQNVVLIGGPGAPARRTWPPRWGSPASHGTASACGFTPRSIWSTPWSRKKCKARPGGLPRA